MLLVPVLVLPAVVAVARAGVTIAAPGVLAPPICTVAVWKAREPVLSDGVLTLAEIELRGDSSAIALRELAFSCRSGRMTVSSSLTAEGVATAGGRCMEDDMDAPGAEEDAEAEADDETDDALAAGAVDDGMS